MDKDLQDLIDEELEKYKNDRSWDLKSRREILVAVLLVLVFVAVVVLQKFISESYISGALAQVQVMASVVLTTIFGKKGYFISLTLNLFLMAYLLVVFYTLGNNAVLPGIIVPIGTIASCTILACITGKLHQTIKHMDKQREKLVALSEEAACAYDEIKTINDELTRKNRIIKLNEDRLNFLAYYDTLTELANRKMLTDKLDAQIYKNNPQENRIVFLLFNIENIRSVNDTLGHKSGDIILKTVAERLKYLVNADDLPARYAGNEFAVMIRRQLDEPEIRLYTKKIIESIRNPINIGDGKYIMNVCCGAAIYPDDGDSSEELYKCADLAMRKALDEKTNIAFFTHTMKEDLLRRLNYERRLETALKNNEFFLVFQPQYYTDSKKLRGFETLIRWKEPELGMVSPSLFIPMAEEIGVINELGDWVMLTACRKISQLTAKYHIGFMLSINISAIQLMQKSFVSGVKNVLAETGINPAQLEFEVTESSVVASVNRAVEVLNEVRALGIKIALDDFGTGYSSLNYLCRMPIDTLKIDKSFIDEVAVGAEAGNERVVSTVITLAHEMNMSIVAEGVEFNNQLDYLKDRKCDVIQGFLWGKPISEELVDRLLECECMI